MTHGGTTTGYTVYACRCEPCREAMREYRIRKQASFDPAKAVHGRSSTYNAGCRCEACRGANREAWRKYQRRHRTPATQAKHEHRFVSEGDLTWCDGCALEVER